LETQETKILQFRRNSWQFLSGNSVKTIALVLMVFDHLYQMFIFQGAPYWFHWLGRPVAILFLFFCAEGFYYTRGKPQYLARLLIGFWLMSAINRLLTRFFPLDEVVLINNIFGTLFMAAFYMAMIDLFRRGLRTNQWKIILPAMGGILLPLLVGMGLLVALGSGNRTAAMILIFIPNPVSAEGGFPLILGGILFYLLRRWRLAQAALVLVLAALAWFTVGQEDPQWLMAFAVIPILLYNGKRGRGGKYFFYFFYPAHIYIFYLIAWFIRRGV
jgi:hypothetical protein